MRVYFIINNTFLLLSWPGAINDRKLGTINNNCIDIS